MATLATMVSRISDEINRTDLSSQAADAIRSAVRFYSTESWGFNDTLTSTVMTVGTYRYALPSDFIAERVFSVDEDSRRSPLEKISFDEFQGRFDTNSTGAPSEYALFGDNIYLYPVPDETLSLILAYTFILPELSDSGSDPWVNELEEVIRMRATADLYENSIRGEEGMQQAVVCRAREAEAVRRHRSKRVLSNATNRIRRRGIL